MEEIVERN